MDAELTAKIWNRLRSGRPVDDLGLGTVDGRLDLRGIVSPQPSTLGKITTPVATMAKLGNLSVVERAHWNGLDFSRSDLRSLRVIDSTIENCRFDGSKCQQLRMWGTKIYHSTFRGVDLRSAALGGVTDGKRNLFSDVDFSKADLRQTAYDSAEFTGCTFSNSNLRKVEFQGSVFVNCVFSGVLEETAFDKYGPSGSKLPPNEMKGVDFRGATLRSVGLRGMDLEDVQWPEGGEHVLVHDYLAALDRAIEILGARSDMPSRQLAAYLGVYRRWAGPNQKLGVLHRGDMRDGSSKEAVDEFLRIIGA